MAEQPNARERRRQRRQDEKKHDAWLAAQQQDAQALATARLTVDMYRHPSTSDEVYEMCVANELRKMRHFQSVQSNPERLQSWMDQANSYSAHPAWFAVVADHFALNSLVRLAFVSAMSTSNRYTLCDFDHVSRNLHQWFANQRRNTDALQHKGRMDSYLYVAFVRVLGKDAWRYVAPIPVSALRRFCSGGRSGGGGNHDTTSRNVLRALVDKLPEACLYCNGDPEQQLVWPRDELAEHLYDVLNYVPALDETGHPRPFVSRLVRDALRDYMQHA